MRSGGRCAICNKYLLELNYDVNIGEMAHIVGWSTAKRSPRGDAPLPAEQRNNVDNLVLLCAEHHKIVDTPELLKEFTVERLIGHKIAHEQRVYHLTDMKADDSTVVLRMFGGIRGLSVELSKEHARQIVFSDAGKFALFPDSFDKHGIEIDLHQLLDPEDSWDAYWQMGVKLIDKSLQPLNEGIKQGHIRHVSVFTLTRIPLMIYLGYQLGDKIPMTIYQKHRGKTETWLWSATAPVEKFEYRQLASAGNDKVTLILSLSGSIGLDDLPAELKEGTNIFEVRPVDTIPNRDIFLNKLSAQNFTKTFHDLLSGLEITHKGCRQIDLVPAIPVAAAVSIGRGVMRQAHPAIMIYDRSAGIYKPTIKINGHETN
ncbi:SAVED domain-containing protein [Mucilaginibacter gossypiicola]|uniref:SAVED domain-containing protein n=1 Tax=Mucilaginibacter gossypiicola TaxID=551995 RepID=UPI00373FE04F